jgi:hypothetical protein
MAAHESPRTTKLYDRTKSVLKASERDQIRQVQRIEQGMGRAIRSNEDYCVVVLMRQRLIAQLYATGATRYFSPATQARQWWTSQPG